MSDLDLGEFVDVMLGERITRAALALASARAARAANGTIRTLVRTGLISPAQGSQLSLQISGQLERETAPVVERPATQAIEALTQARAEPEQKLVVMDADDVHCCPICGVPISVRAVGCRAHWRQVKREAGNG